MWKIKMHLLRETVLYYSMSKNQYYKERTEKWLTRLYIKTLALKEQGFFVIP